MCMKKIYLTRSPSAVKFFQKVGFSNTRLIDIEFWDRLL